jgi:putative ABC transport system substrate-binding protein
MAAEIEDAFPRMKQQGAGAFIISGGGFFSSHMRRIVELAIMHRLPIASTNPPHVQAGAMVNYGPSRADGARRTVYYLDRILKGARPAELPIEQPTKFELGLNLKTAKALGLTIPQSILVRADRVIE